MEGGVSPVDLHGGLVDSAQQHRPDVERPDAIGALLNPLLAEEARSPGEFSEAWLGKLTGKHRQFFDVTSVNSGWALAFAMNFLNSNNETYKLADNHLSAVVGLRHFSVPMAFADDIWARYKLGETLGITDPATKAPSVRNFLFHPRAGDVPFPGMAMEKLMSRGAATSRSPPCRA